MKKIYYILITFCLIFLFSPINTLGQIPITQFPLIDDKALDYMFSEDEEYDETVTLKTFELYWSSNTYVPFGYQGRTLPTKGSFVTVEAYLETPGRDPDSLKYSWFLDGNFINVNSGYGQDSFKFKIGKFGGSAHIVLLKVFNESRSFLVEKSITIPVANPDLVVYNKNNSKVNLPYIASTERFDVLSNKEASFMALPYFFNIKSLRELEFEWVLGAKKTRDSSLVANIFGLKIINEKRAEGLLEEILKVTVRHRIQADQRIQKVIKLNVY